MKIEKSGKVTGLEVDDAELEKINQLTLSPITAEEVFAFRVIACGNDIDRDGEAFTKSALKKLSELYVGKTMITDHDCPQTARSLAYTEQKLQPRERNPKPASRAHSSSPIVTWSGQTKIRV